MWSVAACTYPHWLFFCLLGGAQARPSAGMLIYEKPIYRASCVFYPTSYNHLGEQANWSCFSPLSSSPSLVVAQAGLVMCRRMVCDCDNPNADLFCCPECDPRLSSQCLHQNGLLTYGSGDTWVENCQQCQCLVSTHRRLNAAKKTCAVDSAPQSDTCDRLHDSTLALSRKSR